MSTNETTYLTPVPSFWESMAKALDRAVTLEQYNGSKGPTLADYIILRDDWMAIGQDLSAAIEQYKRQQRECVQS